ncbi:DUF6503 family protein [Aquimarina sediminis]|uniref:DUF6503 family protein n=1 Tax=Aquimarina sediminis TaxID=2070536 RepID=UPI000FFF1B78|nr:DUF6503 family protein [Aquimarina sediminis]
MKTKFIKFTGLLCLLSIFFHSCGLLDIRPKMIQKEGITSNNTIKGKKLLEKAWKKQGYDKLKNHNVYSYHANDTWKGLLGKMAQIWPEMDIEMEFKYQIGTFDGQVHFLDGRQKGGFAGLQNWNYYEISKNDTIFKDKNEKGNRKRVFGIAAFQYFTEMIDRLKNAPIISYAGEKKFRNQQYDLVFCTWSKDVPHTEHDQYLAWINKKTGIMDFAQYTIREAYITPPGYKAIGGAVEFTDFKNINGIMIPHQQLIYAIKLRKNKKRNLHKLVISDFKFDDFDAEELRLDKNISKGGDFKN